MSITKKLSDLLFYRFALLKIWNLSLNVQKSKYLWQKILNLLPFLLSSAYLFLHCSSQNPPSSTNYFLFIHSNEIITYIEPSYKVTSHDRTANVLLLKSLIHAKEKWAGMSHPANNIGLWLTMTKHNDHKYNLNISARKSNAAIANLVIIKSTSSQNGHAHNWLLNLHNYQWRSQKTHKTEKLCKIQLSNMQMKLHSELKPVDQVNHTLPPNVKGTNLVLNSQVQLPLCLYIMLIVNR